jgi:GTPase Era involved in 16S rRNA processing
MTGEPSAALPRIAVVGHTNTGKTSLMRTLLRDERFGAVANAPSTTTGVDVAVVHAAGRDLLELADTPGLEDSVGLLERLESARRPEEDGIDTLRRVLDEPDCARGARFSQEAMALRAVLRADAVLYVVDARDPVKAKHRDELTILGWCARPVVPILNFVADADTQAGAWREQLRRVNMHATASFDTVVYDARGERRLLEKLQSLLHESSGAVDALAEARWAERGELVRASARLIAELLVDVAAFTVRVPLEEHRRLIAGRASGREATTPWLDRFRESVSRREAMATRQLLDRFRFEAATIDVPELDLRDGRWGLDVFSPDAVKRWGGRTGSAAAAGAAIGLGLDAAVGGASLGAGAAAGAMIGGAIALGRTHGRRVMERIRGNTELRADDATLARLATRQLELAAALLRRGHAAVGPVRATVPSPDGSATTTAAAPAIPRTLDRSAVKTIASARARPDWAAEMDWTDPDVAGGTVDAGSPTSPDRPGPVALGGMPDAHRADAVAALAATLEPILRPLAGLD